MAVVILVLTMVRVPQIQNIALLLWLVIIVADRARLGRHLVPPRQAAHRALPEREPEGVKAYAVMRTLQMRRLRLPKPQVKRGERP